jgi:uncharacterized protein (TIGR02145 family)
MRTHLTILSAGIALAMAFTLSCSGGDDNDGDGGGSSSPSYGSGGCPDAEVGNNTVSCGGKTYNTVEIGGKRWMAENLNYDTETDGSKCYDNDPDKCEEYGRFYDWSTAMGICPNGWHLPSKAEWDALSTHIEGDKGCTSCAAKHLKAADGWKGGTGLNSYGFSALPGGGYRTSEGSFEDAGSSGDWWSATEYGGGGAYSRYMFYMDDATYWNYGSNNRGNLLNVRCLQN